MHLSSHDLSTFRATGLRLLLDSKHWLDGGEKEKGRKGELAASRGCWWRSSHGPRRRRRREAVIRLSAARPSPRSYTQYGSTKDTERKLNLVSRGGGGEGQLNEKGQQKHWIDPLDGSNMWKRNCSKSEGSSSKIFLCFLLWWTAGTMLSLISPAYATIASRTAPAATSSSSRR